MTNCKPVFVCNKKDIDSGQFPIEDLKYFSSNANVKIMIKDYAFIEHGEMELIEKTFH